MQDIAVYFIVAGAAGYLARHFWPSKKSDQSCGGCKGCASNKQAPPETQFVQIDLNGSFKR